jgi:Ca-dependent carbohydrate-binding module xylan-binding
MSSTPFPLGVYVGDPDGSDASVEATFETNYNNFVNTLGAQPQFLDVYADQTQPISQWVSNASWQAWSMAQSADTKDMTPVIGLPMTSTATGSVSADQFYKEFASGDYDSVLQGMVKAWAAEGFTTQYWRPGWEMNLTSMPSYAGSDTATQADWVAAFQHISTVLHAAGAADGVNVQVMWNPSITNYSLAGNATQTLYPGNQYVDVIGADVYADLYPYGNQNALYDWDKSGQVLNSSTPVYDSSIQQWASDPMNLMHYYTDPAATQWSEDGSDGHSLSLQNLIDFAKAQGKPIAIAEAGAGSTSDGAGVSDNPTFVQWLSNTLQNAGVPVTFVNIWDSNNGGNYEFSSPSDGKPLEAAAWAQYFGAQNPSSVSSDSASGAPSAVTIGSGSDTIALNMSEDAYQGNAQFTVSVDGTQVGLAQTITALHAAGQSQTVNVEGNWGPGQHVVAINFLNDLYGGSPSADRNLYVNGATIDGTTVSGAQLTLYTSGTQSFPAVTSTTYSLGAAGGSITTLGNDTVDIGSGAVTVNASGPSVSVSGGSGAMTFIANAGAATITAGSGPSTVTGGSGALTFSEGSGATTVTAGTGQEIFNIVNGSAGGSLTVNGFTSGTDTIHLQGYQPTDITSEHVGGGSTQIVLSDNTHILLAGFTASSTNPVFG